MHTILLKLHDSIKNQLLHVLGPTGPSSVSTQLYKTTHYGAQNCIKHVIREHTIFLPYDGLTKPKICRSWFFNIIVILIKLCAFVCLNYYNPILSHINISYLWNKIFVQDVNVIHISFSYKQMTNIVELNMFNVTSPPTHHKVTFCTMELFYQ
jgi:hypothetical protein